MSKRWENTTELEVTATPEQVWDAIATGPGIDSWFMGRTDVDPGQGGTIVTHLGPFGMESDITAWEPGKHLANQGKQAPDGGFIAFEYLIEGRAGGTTVLRTVANGFLPGDDWEAEFDAMLRGGAMYQQALKQYLTHFLGRTAFPVTLDGPPVADWPSTWAAVHAAFGLPSPASDGDTVHCDLDGIGPVDGVVDYAEPGFLGIRTPDALYRFSKNFFTGAVFTSHHVFADPAHRTDTEAAWQTWLASL
jgi:uncharacterized protein YndB with AHSA1/START domain